MTLAVIDGKTCGLELDEPALIELHEGLIEVNDVFVITLDSTECEVLDAAIAKGMGSHRRVILATLLSKALVALKETVDR